MPAARTVLVCEAHVPFVYGGAERHVRGLVRELRRLGYRAKVIVSTERSDWGERHGR